MIDLLAQTPGQQKMFMSKASELVQESSSRQRRSARGRELQALLWTFSRRRDHSCRCRIAR
jgi:hypothetical protein